MSMSDYSSYDNDLNLKKTFFRYFSFWPYFLISIFISLLAAFIFLRYTNFSYESNAKIEILDKAQDSEMALPTAMTIFNRSMINLENEIGVLSSYRLHKKVVDELSSNVKFFSIGTIKTSENHHSEWFEDYDFNLTVKSDTITQFRKFEFEVKKDEIEMQEFDKDNNFVAKYNFSSQSINSQNGKLPFNLTIRDDLKEPLKKSIIFYPADFIIDLNISQIKIVETAKESDQLLLSFIGNNILIGDEYLNTLISEFDKDGVIDRQMEYLSTMEFVDNRSDFLTMELEKVEQRKQNFKESNNLSNIEVDGNLNITQKFTYNSELFSAMSQKDLVLMLKEILKEKKYNLIPVNIGLENVPLNSVISEYNLIIKEYEQYLSTVGSNHPFLKKLENQISENFSNVTISINNYLNSLDVTIENLKKKESEFEDIYKKLPENEKILRSIERELEIKESLFLLLLQKREEAAINYAVIKPSVKIIDSARTSIYSKSPNSINVYLISLLLALFIPIIILYVIFYLDNKIHTREDLNSFTDNIPLVGEIPFISDNNYKLNFADGSARDILSESLRMIIANLNFAMFKEEGDSKKNVILVTSSIKGEGKTIVSANLASILSNKHKTLLIGADLRNPQIHKFLKIDKNASGLSDYIYKSDNNWKPNIIKHKKLDIMLSGTIPPNPTELISSQKFKNFLNDVKKEYDFIIIDSAPCLLVSDTFEISPLVDTSICVVRSNFTLIKLCEFINECKKNNKLKNLNLVLNGVGNSRLYGYKYGYQYGYQYGYAYNYGYGYGYGYEDGKDD